jgi:raffinose/stachyose/melibiose transport system substrate-binding protein
MLNRWSGAVALVALIVTAAGCSAGGSDSDSAEGSGGDVTLKVWGWRQEDTAAYKKIFERYEEEHPGVSVEYVPFKNTEYDTILKTGLTDANGPDVAQLRSYGLLQPLVAAKSLVPLENEVPELADFSDEVLDGARGEEDGKLYGVPFALQTLHLIYNKALFDEHQIEVPTSWSEMIDAFRKLQAADVVPLANTVTDNWMLPIEHEIFGATTYGGPSFLTEMLEGGKKFTDPAWVESVKTWKSTAEFWAPKSSGTSYTDAQALFSSGRAAMFPGGIWEIAGFKKANPDLELGIFNPPPAPGAATDATLVPGYVDGSFGVAAKSKNREAALELVRWMATQEFGQAFSDELQQISAVPDVEPKDELLAQALEDYEANPSPYITYAYFSGGNPTAWDLASAAFSEVVLDKSTPEQAAAKIQRGVDQWFEPRS